MIIRYSFAQAQPDTGAVLVFLLSHQNKQDLSCNICSHASRREQSCLARFYQSEYTSVKRNAASSINTRCIIRQGSLSHIVTMGSLSRIMQPDHLRFWFLNIYGRVCIFTMQYNTEVPWHLKGFQVDLIEIRNLWMMTHLAFNS
jgi:hypothetical protein